jgi:hypothetical protein
MVLFDFKGKQFADEDDELMDEQDDSDEENDRLTGLNAENSG